MRTKSGFSAFSARLTRSYALLAIVLIAVVTLASSVLAFINFTANLNESLDGAAARTQERIQFAQSQHRTLAQIAPELVNAEQRVHVAVFDGDRRPLAGTLRPPERAEALLGTALDIHPRRVRAPGGGVVFIAPDLDRFMRYIGHYWVFMTPIGIVAVLLAWLVGRNITRRAVAPLIDVSTALRQIADGNFTPQLLVERDTGLQELTSAYNDVAQRLNAATLEQRRQEAEMRQFIADAGHELRTPLTIFMGYLDALRQGMVQDSSAVAKVHATMLDESRKMRTIIEKLILLARMEHDVKPKLERVDLNSVAERAVDALRPLSDGRVHFRANGGAVVAGDDAELYEAVKNVIENAVRYAPESPVDVSVERGVRDAVITVQDRGPGMRSTDIEHAFDRFYRGSAPQEIEGSGLGLAIAKRAVERIGGSIELESGVDRGTRVVMTFPTMPLGQKD